MSPELNAASKKWIGGAVALGLLLALGLWLLPWKMRHVSREIARQFDGPVATASQDLQLRPEQRRQIEALEQTYRATLRDLCQRHCAARMQIGETLRGGRGDPETLRRLSREAGAAYSATEEATLEHILRVAQVLDAGAQRQAFQNKVAAAITATCPMEFK